MSTGSDFISRAHTNGTHLLKDKSMILTSNCVSRVTARCQENADECIALCESYFFRENGTRYQVMQINNNKLYVFLYIFVFPIIFSGQFAAPTRTYDI
jgi:hypothetical protein